MEVDMFNHHILMLLSTQLGQVQSASWFGASSHFPDDNTALYQPLVLSGTGRRVIKNGHYGGLSHWRSCTEPFLPGLQGVEKLWGGSTAWEGHTLSTVLPKMP